MNDATLPAAITNETIVALFRRAAHLMARAYHHTGHAHHAQRHVLSILRGRKTLNQRELMEILGVRSASLSELLAKLEQNGLVSRTRDERDRRNFVVAITEAGLAAADEGKEEKESANTVLAMLEKPERQTLGELLIKIILTLEEEFPDGPPYRKRHECGPCEGHPRGCHGHGPHHPLRERGQQGGREEDSTRPTPSGDGKPTREGK